MGNVQGAIIWVLRSDTRRQFQLVAPATEMPDPVAERACVIDVICAGLCCQQTQKSRSLHRNRLPKSALMS